LTSAGLRYKKLENMPQYIVCHFSGADWW
jgi:hypothetical protein